MNPSALPISPRPVIHLETPGQARRTLIQQTLAIWQNLLLRPGKVLRRPSRSLLAWANTQAVVEAAEQVGVKPCKLRPKPWPTGWSPTGERD